MIKCNCKKIVVDNSATFFIGGFIMAKSFSRKFYNTQAWVKTAKAFKQSKFGLCEKCGKPGEEVHHIIALTPDNINDPNITLNWNNLMLLCRSCHELIEEKAKATRDGIKFDEFGQVVEIFNDIENPYE